jgi:hypothetical protein
MGNRLTSMTVAQDEGIACNARKVSATSARVAKRLEWRVPSYEPIPLRRNML